MANPQKENGYTRIANEILEHTARTKLSGGEFRVLMMVWRYTYGFGRKEHKLAITFLAEATNLSKRATQKYIDRLLDRKILIGNQVGTARKLGFNKNYEEWELEEVKEEEKEQVPVEKPKKKPKKRVYEETDTFYKMAEHFLTLVKPVAEEANVPHLIANANLQTWADDFRKLWEIDKVQDKKQISAVMQWVTQNDFWRTNVLSAKTFRKQYTQLAIKMAADQKPKQSKFKHPSHFESDPRDVELAFNKWCAAGGDPDEFVYNE